MKAVCVLQGPFTSDDLKFIRAVNFETEIRDYVNDMLKIVLNFNTSLKVLNFYKIMLQKNCYTIKVYTIKTYTIMLQNIGMSCVVIYNNYKHNTTLRHVVN